VQLVFKSIDPDTSLPKACSIKIHGAETENSSRQMMAAECMPRSIYIGTVVLLTAATVVSLLQKHGALEGGKGRAILRSYSDCLGLAGVTSLAQVMPQFTQYPISTLHNPTSKSSM